MPTKVQTSVVSSNSTFANFKSWAGDITATPGTGTGIAAALFTLGFTKQTDTYTAKWDNGTTIGDTARPTAAGSLSASGVFPTTSNNSRAGLASTAFKGAWAVGTTYSQGQVVTDNAAGAQIVYIYTNATPSAGNATTDTTHWSPYWMEIWLMHNATLGSTADIYIKIEYGCTATQNNPDLFIQIGTVYAANSGVINGAATNFTVCEQVINAAGTQTANEVDISGDGQNYLGMLLWRNTSSNSFYAIERNIRGTVASAPVYDGVYITYAVCPRTNTLWRSNSMFISTSSLASPGTTPRLLGVPTLALQVAAQTLIIANNSPAFPVFPLVGYVGNPMTVLIGLSASDAVEGASITSTVYGATHTYLVTIGSAFANGLGNGVAGNWALGLRWE